MRVHWPLATSARKEENMWKVQPPHKLCKLTSLGRKNSNSGKAEVGSKVRSNPVISQQVLVWDRHYLEDNLLCCGVQSCQYYLHTCTYIYVNTYIYTCTNYIQEAFNFWLVLKCSGSRTGWSRWTLQTQLNYFILYIWLRSTTHLRCSLMD